MCVPKVYAIRVSMVEVRAVFGFAERDVLWIDIHILRQRPRCQTEARETQ